MSSNLQALTWFVLEWHNISISGYVKDFFFWSESLKSRKNSLIPSYGVMC